MDPSENSLWWNLPADIQSDILSRLAGDTLISLKFVCWGWYNLISYICIPRLAPPSPEASFCGIIFRDRQKEGVGPASRLRLFALRRQSNFDVAYHTIKNRLREDYRPEDIQDCCNGILLVVHHHNDGGVHYIVYNPTTGESIRVPQPQHSYHCSHHTRTTQCCFASLAFEPTKSFHYKIICTHGGNITNPLKVETFSSQTRKWLAYVVDIDSKLDGVDWIRRCAYLDGRIYRLLKTNYLACIDQGKSSQLLSVQAIELPNCHGDNMSTDDSNCYGYIGISRRRLHYATRDRNGSTLLVYMLKDGISWLLKHTITIDDLLANPCSYLVKGIKRIVNKYCKEAWFNFYAFHPNCDHLFLITPCAMLSYSPKEKSLIVCHIEGGEREIVVGQNYSFPYSHCPVILQSAFQRTCANLDMQLPEMK